MIKVVHTAAIFIHTDFIMSLEIARYLLTYYFEISLNKN